VPPTVNRIDYTSSLRHDRRREEHRLETESMRLTLLRAPNRVMTPSPES
jgi:hypothetical protein